MRPQGKGVYEECGVYPGAMILTLRGLCWGIYMYLDTVLNAVIAAHENLHL